MSVPVMLAKVVRTYFNQNRPASHIIRLIRQTIPEATDDGLTLYQALRDQYLFEAIVSMQGAYEPTGEPWTDDDTTPYQGKFAPYSW